MSNSAQFPVLNERKVTGASLSGRISAPGDNSRSAWRIDGVRLRQHHQGAGQDTADTVNAVQGAGHKVAYAVQ